MYHGACLWLSEVSVPKADNDFLRLSQNSPGSRAALMDSLRILGLLSTDSLQTLRLLSTDFLRTPQAFTGTSCHSDLIRFLTQEKYMELKRRFSG